MDDGSTRWDRQLIVQSAVGTDLWVGVVGDGPAALLCDGLGCDGFIWKHIIADLSRDHTVIRWHYRGHGRSERPADLGDMAVAGLAEDLFLVLDALDIDEAMCAGHSMGVQVVLEAALGEQGQRLTSLLLLCGAPGRPLDSFKNTSLGLQVFPLLQRAARRQPEVVRAIWRTTVPSRLALLMAQTFEINAALIHVEELRPYLQTLATMDPLAFLAMLDDASRHSVEDRLDRVLAQTLVVAAERDTFTPMSRSLPMARNIPGAELFVLPDATHIGPLEWPELLNLRIRRFLRDDDNEATHARAWSA